MTQAVEIYRPADDRARYLVPIEQPRREEQSDRLDLRMLVTTFRRQFKLFLAVLLGVVAFALFVTLRQTPLYTASAQVVLNSRLEQVVDQKQVLSELPSAQSGAADTEVQILESRELASQVARALQLDRDPRFNMRTAPPTGLLTRIRALFGTPPPEAPQMNREALAATIASRLRGGLEVSRIGQTYSITIAYTSPDPAMAARVANEYARQYTRSQVDLKHDASRTATEFLARRLEELRRQAQADTARAQQYRIANNLLSTSGASLTEQEISTYNQQVALARAQASEDEARLNTARAQLRGGSTGEDVGEALSSSVIGSMRGRYTEVSGRVANLEARYGPRHPEVLKARSELADITQQIQSEINRVISNLEAKVRVSRQRLASLTGSLSGARGALAQNNRSMVGLDDLQRRADASQQLYDSYLARYKETSAQSGTERPDARIISLAEPPAVPSSPRLGLNLFLSIVIGSGLGLAAAFVAELTFSGLTTGDDVEDRLKCRYLGNVPLLSSLKVASRSPLDAVVDEPGSAYAEAFRSLRTSLRYAVNGPVETLVVTSALPKEGKTTIALCLARSAASQGERVVVVDCDLRQRRISRLFGREEKPGLVELLRGQATLDDALVLDEPSGAYILPVNHPGGDIGDALVGEAMDGLIEQLRARFGLVILDTAPVLPIADARVLAAKADAVIVVARWRKTPDHAVRAALRLLPSHRVTIAGVVLSRVDMRKQARFGYGDTGFYYNQYKGYYA